MAFDVELLAARAEFYGRAWPHREYLRYVKQHKIDVALVAPFTGGTAVTPIAVFDHERFDWGDPNGENVVAGFVCEAIDADGETTLDLVAWPLDQPGRVLTMFGRASLLGLWTALNPATFYMGKALVMHRTPLEWLAAGCAGAAVVIPKLAGWVFPDIRGPIAARDQAHGRQLMAIARSIVDERQIVVATAAGIESAA